MNEIQATVLDIAHVQSLVVVTSTVPVVPSGGIEPVGAGDTDTWHRTAIGAVMLVDVDEQAVNPRTSEMARSSRVATTRAALQNARPQQNVLIRYPVPRHTQRLRSQ